jgi:uncharacterized protein YndB with AHSA1/START domain
MQKNDQVYVTYIRTTPENLWAAITKPEFARQYWGGCENVSDWKKGSKWQHFKGEGKERDLLVAGEVLESVPPKRLVISWVDPDNAGDASRVTFEIENLEGTVCLTVKHGDFKPGSAMEPRVGGGWPRVLSSMKSFLETGKPLDLFSRKNCG